MKLTIEEVVIVLTMFLFGCVADAQVQTNTSALNDIGWHANHRTANEKADAETWAILHGAPVKIVTPRGSVMELMRVVNDKPIYYTTFNLNAADTISVDELWPGGVTGYSLTGSGITLGIWDAGAVYTAHTEFGGRAVQRDSATVLNNHATHVGGTMIAAGVYAPAKGMSYQGNLNCYDWNNDLSEMATAAVGGLRVSNHSYGIITGWYYSGSSWVWYGDSNVSSQEDYKFGYYDYWTAEWDDVAYNAPYYLICKAAGNDRGEGPIGGVYPKDGGNNGYDTISSYALAKNILTVGAVSDLVGGFAPGQVVMSSFSGWGPADDGRIKPDISANGVALVSCLASANSYGNYSGTSMATPNVSGAVGLLIQQYRSVYDGVDPRSATMKALLIHTADECGNAAGPDYAYGWGLLNSKTAAELIMNSIQYPEAITQTSLSTGQTYSATYLSDGSPIKVTIVWTDPPGDPPTASLDPTDIMLVNDLDLRVTKGDTTYYPWILNPAQPSAAATTGDNIVDNVEQISIAAPTAGTYTVQVTHKGNLYNGVQSFSIVTTGLSLTAPTVPPSAVNDSYDTDEDTALNEPADGVLANDINGGGDPLTTILVSNPSHGQLTLNADGSFLYTPQENYNGDDSFTYRATNGTDTSGIATVTVHIASVNDAPVSVADAYTAHSNIALNTSSPGVLANDKDTENDDLTASLVTSVSHGQLTLRANGSFDYTPSQGYVGQDSFTYRAYDGEDYGNTVTVSLTVNAVNASPIAVNDSYAVSRSRVLTVSALQGLLANDSDADDTNLTVTLIRAPTRGRLVLQSNGSFVYRPFRAIRGTDRFVYRVSDGHGGTSTGTVYLNY